jgi:hypothetical protein
MRPAWTKRRCAHKDDDPSMGRYFHACWQHASKLEDDTFDVPDHQPAAGSKVEDIHHNERDSAGVWCGFCN